MADIGKPQMTETHPPEPRIEVNTKPKTHNTQSQQSMQPQYIFIIRPASTAWLLGQSLE